MRITRIVVQLELDWDYENWSRIDDRIYASGSRKLILCCHFLVALVGNALLFGIGSR